MTNDAGAILDDLLCRWHHWASADRFTRGWNDRALVVGEYVISRQYDDSNGALDAAIERRIMRAVDFQVSEMADPHRAAIHANARGLAHGCAVFGSARLPADREERATLVIEARLMLMRRLHKAGIV